MSGVTSGISVSQELSSEFQSSSGTRVIKVAIDKESLVVSKTLPLSSSFSHDVKSISNVVEEDVPAYLLVQQDAKGKWILVSYVPDTASVRHKMLYASTRTSLTRGLGAPSFVDSVFVSSSSDLAPTLLSRSPSTSSGTSGTLTSPGSAPLSSREAELASIRAAEAKEQERDTTPRSHVNRIGMAWEPGAEEAVRGLRDADGALVVLGAKTSKEKDEVVLKSVKTVPVEHGLANALPKGEPSYVFYAFSHAGQQSILFIYVCPNDSSIKEKMVYSSSRWSAILRAQELGIKVARKLETSDLSELTHSYLLSEVYPDGPPSGTATPQGSGTDTPPSSGTVSAQRGFARPRGPGRRAAA